MLTSGDVVDLDLGIPAGSEAGLRRPAIVITADRVLRAGPSVVQVAPITSTRRGYRTEVDIDPNEGSGLSVPGAIQCQHVRSVSVSRIREVVGNVGPVKLAEARETIGFLLDIPA